MKMRKLLSLLLVLCMMLALLPAVASAEEAEIVASGSCGEKVYWKLDDKGTLTIYGEGPMENYQYPFKDNPIPWQYESEHDYSKDIKAVVIEEGVTNIAGGLFWACTNLNSVTLPEHGITSIGNFAFYSCTALETITIPEGVTSIGDYAFEECTNLSKISIPSSVTYIGACAFMGCEKLTSITLPLGLETIEGQAFSGSGLIDVTIPKSVTRMVSAFSYCDNLKKVTFLGNNPDLSSDFEFENVTATIYYPAKNKTWENAVGKDYGGNLTWVSFEPEDPVYDEPITVYFSTFEELKELEGEVLLFGSEAIYNGTEPLVIKEDLTLPRNLSVSVSMFDPEEEMGVKVPKGVTFTFDSLSTNRLIVEGTANSRSMYVSKKLGITGALNVESFIMVNPDTEISGLNLNKFDIEKKDYAWILTPKDDVGDDPTDDPTDDPGKKPDVPTDTPDDSGEIGETTPMYRLYNPNSGEHFYTGSVEEKDTLVSAGWNYEGIAWNAPTNSGDPVYRCFNPNSSDHHYTMSWEEVENLVAVGWQYEGIAWNSAGAEGNVPQYRLYNPNAVCGIHHYTSSTEERDYLVSLGWVFEGIGWYGMAQ